MTRGRGPDGGASRCLLALVLVVVLGVAGCSGDEPPEPPDGTATGMALSVETASVAGKLSAKAQADAETAVGDVLSHYVVEGFLGDYPRQNFVGAFDAFTGRAAAGAARDIDLLTANLYRQATSVRPTRLDARLSFLVDDSDVVGAAAHVRLGFEAALADGGTSPFMLQGRLVLVEEDGTWSVVGYDVIRDDAVPTEAEVTS